MRTGNGAASNRDAPTIVLYAGRDHPFMPRATLLPRLASLIALHAQPNSTWFDPAVVSTTPACDDSTRVGNTTGGDYFGIAAASDGSFRLLWSEMRNGQSELVTVSVASSARR